MNTNALWQALTERGLVSGAAPLDHNHPWPIRLMVGAGAWAGSLFVLAFLGALTFELLEHSATRLVLAGLSLAAGRYLATRRELLTEQLGLVAAALAQTLVVWSIFDDVRGQEWSALALMALGAASLWVPLALFRVWNGVLCLSALVMLLDAFKLPGAVALMAVISAALAALWWLRPVLTPRYALLRSLAIAAALFAVGAAISLSRATVELWLGPERAFTGAALASAGLLLINLGVVWMLTRPHRYRPIAPLLLIGMLGLATWTTPAVGAALLMILLGYGRGERGLLALGLIALPLALSGHYYVLSWSLNLKALSLASCGLLLLAARQWLITRPPRAEGATATQTGAGS